MQDCLALRKDLKAEILDDIWCEWCVLQYTIGLLGSLRSHHFEQFDLAPTHKCEGNFDKDTLRVSHVIDPEECAIYFLVPLSIILHNLSFDTVGFRALQVPYLLQVSMHTLQSWLDVARLISERCLEIVAGAESPLSWTVFVHDLVGFYVKEWHRGWGHFISHTIISTFFGVVHRDLDHLFNEGVGIRIDKTQLISRIPSYKASLLCHTTIVFNKWLEECVGDAEKDWACVWIPDNPSILNRVNIEMHAEIRWE